MVRGEKQKNSPGGFYWRKYGIIKKVSRVSLVRSDANENYIANYIAFKKSTTFWELVPVFFFIINCLCTVTRNFIIIKFLLSPRKGNKNIPTSNIAILYLADLKIVGLLLKRSINFQIILRLEQWNLVHLSLGIFKFTSDKNTQITIAPSVDKG